MKQIKSLREVTPSDVGKYIRLGGMGIMDGLKGNPTRHDCYKIEQVTPDAIHAREYRARRASYVPSYNWNQSAIIYTPAEVKHFPVLW